MVEVSSERTATLIFPLPIEFLRLVDTLAAGGAEQSRRKNGVDG
jgi:hypothetical protein